MSYLTLKMTFLVDLDLRLKNRAPSGDFYVFNLSKPCSVPNLKLASILGTSIENDFNISFLLHFYVIFDLENDFFSDDLELESSTIFLQEIRDVQTLRNEVLHDSFV